MFFKVLFLPASFVTLLFLRKSLLLLQELVKETPEGHVDYADLRKCEETIKDLAAQINEAKRLFENCQVSAEIDYKHFTHTFDLFERRNYGRYKASFLLMTQRICARAKTVL